MKKILITGGAIHAKLDDVKIITNRFKGGLMAELAQTLGVGGGEVTYLTAKGSKIPSADVTKIIYHDGVFDYMKQVLELAPEMDAVILGGAVANLIPVTPFVGKFPSHNYKPGDKIDIPFTIAPRIIDQVRKVAPKTILLGFKLLSGVPLSELIDAAYGVLHESKSVAVIANDATDLSIKYIVTPTGFAQRYTSQNYHQFIIARLKEDYYTTVLDPGFEMPAWNEHDRDLYRLAGNYCGVMTRNAWGHVFGSIAMRHKTLDGFYTTARRKEISISKQTDWGYVSNVDHVTRKVFASARKVTLNAPLFDHIFDSVSEVGVIIHYHKIDTGLPKMDYATPGTVQDSIRKIPTGCREFEIDGHGVFRLFKNVEDALSFDPHK